MRIAAILIVLLIPVALIVVFGGHRVYILQPLVSSDWPIKLAEDAAERHDYDKAIELLQPLVEHGVTKAREPLGNIYILKKNYPTAMKLFAPLAEQGNENAQYKMGILYSPTYNKNPTHHDFEDAYFWLSLADKAGYKAAGAELSNNIEMHLTSDERAVLDKKVKDWKPTPAAPTQATTGATTPGPVTSRGSPAR